MKWLLICVFSAMAVFATFGYFLAREGVINTVVCGVVLGIAFWVVRNFG